jgi:neutral ceramidase
MTGLRSGWIGALALTLLLAAPLRAAVREMKAGSGRVDITPGQPIWLSGYASRTHPSTGALTKLWAKSLAMEDEKGSRVVIVTTDLIGLPRAITDAVSARAAKEYGLERSRILFNSSHTHTGPVVKPNLMTMFHLNDTDRAVLDAYAAKLSESLFQVVGAALSDLAPARIDYGFGETGFAMNRREATPHGVKIGVNPGGPMDRTVPVVRVTSPDGTLRAVLFAYACHNTTLTGEFYEISGDYAGYAQQDFEEKHPGATAMFMMLCGGDQNPYPRSTLDLAKQHGAALAAEADRVIAGKLIPLNGPVRTALEITELDFAPHTREQFETELNSTNSAAVRRAQAMLKAYDERQPVRRTPYPVQAIRFGKNLTLLALGGEVVVDYDLRAKREFSGQNLIVAGYSNDVMCYIPSKRVLNEGGYEAVDSMIYYGQPGPFAQDVEDRIFASIHRVMRRVGVK